MTWEEAATAVMLLKPGGTDIVGPHPTTVPLDCTATPKSYPAAIAVTFERPGGIGVAYCQPHCCTVPSASNARLNWEPPAMATTLLNPGSRPSLLPPQAKRVPSARRARPY